MKACFMHLEEGLWNWNMRLHREGVPPQNHSVESHPEFPALWSDLWVSGLPTPTVTVNSLNKYVSSASDSHLLPYAWWANGIVLFLEKPRLYWHRVEGLLDFGYRAGGRVMALRLLSRVHRWMSTEHMAHAHKVWFHWGKKNNKITWVSHSQDLSWQLLLVEQKVGSEKLYYTYYKISLLKNLKG